MGNASQCSRLAGLFAMAALSTSCGTQSDSQAAAVPAPAPLPEYEITITSVSCDTYGPHTTFKFQARNTGRDAIPHVSVFSTIGGKPATGYFLPTSLPLGAVGEYTGMAKPPGDCQMPTAQDADGQGIRIRVDLPEGASAPG